MTDQEINVAIARVCGYEFCGSTDDGMLKGKDKSDGKWKQLPDYCHDMNAMHEAADLVRINDEHAYGCMCSWLHENTRVAAWATARQRAEAFLRTVGKWQASPTPQPPA